MKRILSFILSVCIIMSLVPVISASAEGDAAYQLVYDFRNVDEFVNKGQMDTSKVKFTTTDGTFEFHSTNSSKITYRNSYIEIQEGDGVYFAVVLNVPYSGVFSANLSYYQYDNTASNSKLQNTEGDVYLLKDTVTDVSKATAEDKVSDIATAVVYGKPDSESAGTKEIISDEEIPLSAGKYILVFEQTQRRGGSSGQRMRPITLTLTSGSGDAYATVPSYINKASIAKTTLEIDEITSYEFSGWMNDYSAFDETSKNVTVTSKNGCVSIDNNAKSITAVKGGNDIITFSVSNGGKVLSREVELTVKSDENEAITNAFNATETPATGYVESTVTGLTTDSTIEASKNSDGTFKLIAPETKDNAKFLYWAKGMSENKKIVSFSNELSNYMPEENGKNYLIAVYENDVPETAEYYNANGQRIATGTAPELPSMAGYGKASEWNRYGETDIYVAQYDKTEPIDVTITVENGYGTATVPYGEAITCTADESNGTFLWWQKDVNGEVEIVSIDKSYTFLAYKDCAVTAVYGDEAVSVIKPAKIIIDVFGKNNVMAEFIGFGSNVVEKGIMFNDTKIAMTSPGNQFTITADKSGTYKGYAIIKDDSGYTLVTDGETEVTIEE